MPTQRNDKKSLKTSNKSHSKSHSSSTARHINNKSRHSNVQKRALDLDDPTLIPKPEGRPGRSKTAIVKGYNIQHEMGLDKDNQRYYFLEVSLYLACCEYEAV